MINKEDILSKKHLVTSGCSFTNGFQMFEKGSWAYYLADILGTELHNQAKGGAGNEYICDSIIYYLEANPDIMNNCVVGIAWSEVTRLLNPRPLDHKKSYDLRWWDTIRPQDFLKSKLHGNGHMAHLPEASVFFSDIAFCIYRTYMSVIKLTYFLKANNIPYFFIDAINKNKVRLVLESDGNRLVTRSIVLDGNIHFSEPLHFEINLDAMRDVFTKQINDKFFGEFLNIGGYDTILEFMYGDEDDSNKRYNRLEKGNSGHPNDIASKEIAESIYNQILNSKNE